MATLYRFFIWIRSITKFFNGKYLSFLLLLCSSIYSVYTLTPFRKWLRWSDYISEPLPEINFGDSTFYISQIREIRNGNYNLQNPIIFEHSKDGYSAGNSILFYFWGTIGNIFNLETIQIYLIMIIISSVLLILSVFIFYRNFFGASISLFFTLSICILFMGPLSRPSPTEQLLYLQIFCIFLISPSPNRINYYKFNNTRFRYILFGICSVILLLGNALYSIFIFVYSLLIWLFFEKKHKIYFYISFFLNITFYFYNIFILDAIKSELNLRFGITDSRVPGAIKITIPCIFILLILSILLKLKNSKFTSDIWFFNRIKIYLILTLSMLISVNSQIFTGKMVPMESHFNTTWKILIGLYLIEATSLLLSKKFLNFDKFRNVKRFIPFFLLISLILMLTSFKQIQTYESPRTLLIKSIKDDKKVKTVLIKDNSPFISIEENLLYSTETYLYWSGYASISKATNQELLHRFACRNTETLNFNSFKLRETEIFLNKYSNKRQKYIQLNKFLNFFRFKIKSISDAHQIENYRVYLNSRDKCSKNVYSFRLDKIIN